MSEWTTYQREVARIGDFRLEWRPKDGAVTAWHKDSALGFTLGYADSREGAERQLEAFRPGIEHYLSQRDADILARAREREQEQGGRRRVSEWTDQQAEHMTAVRKHLDEAIRHLDAVFNDDRAHQSVRLAAAGCRHLCVKALDNTAIRSENFYMPEAQAGGA